jgi:hypothetical protein
LEDYTSLPQGLRIRTAVIIKPLEKAQVEMYLKRQGKSMMGVRTLLKDDPSLEDLLSTPLMLAVMTLTYKNRSVASLRKKETIEERRRTIWNEYIDQMLSRRISVTEEQRKSIKSHLLWLAKVLKDERTAVFYIEELQPTSLDKRWAALYISVLSIISGVFAMLSSYIFTMLMYLASSKDRSPKDMVEELIYSVFIGFSVAVGAYAGNAMRFANMNINRPRRNVVIGFIVALMCAMYMYCQVLLDTECTNCATYYSIRTALISLPVLLLVFYVCRFLRISLRVGVGTGIAVGISEIARQGLSLWQGSLETGLTFGIIAGLVAEMASIIIAVEVLHWNWKTGLALGISVGLLYSALAWHDDNLVRIFQVFIGYSVTFGLIGGLMSHKMEEKRKPNQGIRQSGGNALVGLGIGILVWFLLKLSTNTGLESRSPVIIGLMWMLRGGLFAFMQHFTLRLLMYFSGTIPRGYVLFLEKTVECLLLKRSGNGYMFIHQLLQEHFQRERESER